MFAPEPPAGLIAWMASPSTVTQLGGQAAMTGEVRILPARGLECGEQFRWQALLQCQSRPRVDMQPISLPTPGEPVISFVHRDLGACLP